MTDLVFQVQSLVSAGPDRVNVSLIQVDPDAVVAPINQAPTTPSTAFFGANLSLNLSQAEAAAYDVNQRYTLSLTQQKASSPPPSA